MSIRAKGGLGKLTGVATLTRKDGTKEEIPFESRINKEQLQKIQTLNSNNSKVVNKKTK